jgi:hypothetical protein
MEWDPCRDNLLDLREKANHDGNTGYEQFDVNCVHPSNKNIKILNEDLQVQDYFQCIVLRKKGWWSPLMKCTTTV